MTSINNIKSLTNKIKTTALNLGFDACGITKAEFLKTEEKNLRLWLSKGMHGDMHYMSTNFDKRLDTSLLVEGGKSVILVLLNYFPNKKPTDKNNFKIAKYAYGKDYHFVMKAMLKNLLNSIQKFNNGIQGRVFVDSAPILEKALAARAGLGWIGKNSLLINKKFGSFVFIGEIIVNIKLEYDKPIKEYCGTCSRCIDTCPTNAIENRYIIDSTKCISYNTIELKEKQLTEKLKNKMNNWIFGCDICQDICPWNKKLKPNNIPELLVNPELLRINKEQWSSLTEDNFNRFFKGSALERCKYTGLKRNIGFVLDE